MSCRMRGAAQTLAAGLGKGSSPCGLTMVEITITIAILALIMIGVLTSLSTSFMAQRNNTDLLECQFLTQRVLEEVKSTSYDGLLSFNGTRVDDPSGKYRASISASSAATNLVRVEVVTTARDNPESSARMVTLISNPQ